MSVFDLDKIILTSNGIFFEDVLLCIEDSIKENFGIPEIQYNFKEEEYYVQIWDLCFKASMNHDKTYRYKDGKTRLPKVDEISFDHSWDKFSYYVNNNVAFDLINKLNFEYVTNYYPPKKIVKYESYLDFLKAKFGQTYIKENYLKDLKAAPQNFLKNEKKYVQLL